MKYRIQKIIYSILTVIVLFCCVVLIATEVTEKHAVSPLSTAKVDLTEVAQKTTLSQSDYDLLFKQTGLGKTDIDLIWDSKADIYGEISAYQRRFFSDPAYICDGIAGFSRAERIVDSEDDYQFYDVQEGDVFLTKSTHTLCYRHGHSSLYLGGEEKELLEATVIGAPVTCTKAAAWGGYPTGIQLRITTAMAASVGMTPAELGEAVVAYAREEILGDNYDLLAGAFGIGANSDDTQCAYLIYEAFSHFGVNVSTREFPVTPTSLLNSGAFEIIQVWGLDPENPGW